MSLVNDFLLLNISYEGGPLSHDDLIERTGNLANIITSKNIKGQIVLIWDKDPLLLSYKFFSVLDAGGIPTPISSLLSPKQIEEIRAENSNWNYWGDEFGQSAGPKQYSYPNSYACMTSGTTGKPSLCFLNVDTAFLNAKAHGNSIKLTKDNTIIQSLPIYHSFGIVCYLFSSLYHKNKLDFNRVFLGLRSLKKRSYKNAIIHLSPSQVRFLLKEKVEAPDWVNSLSIGGGVIFKHELEKLQAKFDKASIYVTYGLTEAGPRVSTIKYDENHKQKSIGFPISDVKLKVFHNSKTLDYGEGTLLVKSPSIMQNISKEQMIDGYLLTRDHVLLSKNKEIIFKSRESDIVDVGGVTLYCSDIEEQANRLESVHNSIVFPIQHEIYGEVPAIAVEGDITEEELIEHLKNCLSSIQFPKKILILDEFPKVGLGKINRRSIMEKINEVKK